MSNSVASSPTLFERIGGMDAVNAAVDIFYQKVIADDRISHFFKSIDVKKQAGKMKVFLAYAFGAPLPYSGKNMRAAHAHLPITEAHFNAVAENLQATLQELQVDPAMVEEVLAVAAGTKNEVLDV